jgi:hypothetical protein
MTTAAYTALQKQVALLSGGRALTGLNLRVLEIALEGMNVPPERRRETIQAAIQAGRDQAEARRAALKGVADENP